jgi:hypothetical protein
MIPQRTFRESGALRRATTLSIATRPFVVFAKSNTPVAPVPARRFVIVLCTMVILSLNPPVIVPLRKLANLKKNLWKSNWSFLNSEVNTRLSL